MDYTRRNLSLPIDKLNALSALAAEVKRLSKLDRPPGKYLAGLWEHDLDRQLLWRARVKVIYPKGVGRLGAARVPVYRAPSWSWASLHDRFKAWWGSELSNDGSVKPCFELVDCAIIPRANSSPYGEVSGGMLRIRSRLVPGTTFDDFICWVNERWDYEAPMSRPGTDERNEFALDDFHWADYPMKDERRMVDVIHAARST